MYVRKLNRMSILDSKKKCPEESPAQFQGFNLFFSRIWDLSEAMHFVDLYTFNNKVLSKCIAHENEWIMID